MRITRSSLAALLAAIVLPAAFLAPTVNAFAPSIPRLSNTHVTSDTTYHHCQIPSRASSRCFSAPLSQPTELPDSLADAASIAANACHQIHLAGGPMTRCRVDFDTSVGDETYTTLKSSTEFMQQFVSALSLVAIPGVMERKQAEVMRLVQAKAELKQLKEDEMNATDIAEDEASGEKVKDNEINAEREAELIKIVESQGADPTPWAGPKLRIYFPDEGSAALARRDWKREVPPCVEFSSCGGVQTADVTSDSIIIFFCPRASEAEFVEEILYRTEETRGDELMMTVMVNPLLVDMGVTGFGMAGRRLRERLIDNLIPAYYLRTLPWGALTRVWPQLFTVWQDDENAEGGYRMIKAMDRLPSNPEVEDIYDIENGDKKEPGEGPGFLESLSDFVNGMTRL
ncbi:hypothetical protein HJC23_008109 [Cyclotella cryptica]|uniref:DUF1995 domain-containing protein n=1 Tax=Cyclotella cryptica TaxID=29204 RepID=A0ABD3PDU7_9STRA|eukprot:CCRYP_015602-RA/>CCRYP_015602-RA protein AED:0.19 eAED:0.19 QI:130/1/1/1/0/0/2/133/399